MPRQAHHRGALRHRDLEVDSASKRCLERGGNPIPADTDLFEHDVCGPKRDVGELLGWARVTNRESAAMAPKVQAAIKIRDKQLGD